MATRKGSGPGKLGDFEINMIRGLMPPGTLEKSDKKPAHKVAMMVLDPLEEIQKDEDETGRPGWSPLAKSIVNMLNGPRGSIERLAFDVDPAVQNSLAGIYKQKVKLIPDLVLKRIAIQDDLVAAIANTRGNHVGSFGRPRPDRHSKGFVIEPRPEVLEDMSPEDKRALQARIDRAERHITHCGRTDGWRPHQQMTFTNYLKVSTKNAIILGRLATEAIYALDESGNKVFHSFRPADAGTIYRAAPHPEAVEAVRQEAKNLLEQVRNKRFEKEAAHAVDPADLAWVQVIDGVPKQAFSDDEMLVENFYPVCDVEMDGYPVTPLDTVISAVTTHINITNHNKMYFQNGRAARGMLLLQSDDVEDHTIESLRQQFNATINSTNNSWRMPVFGVGKDETVSWQPIDQGGRDMEFQYLCDMNARVIMSAFQISPDELPGWSHLSRGTNQQSLSEGNNEYQLEAARDVGIRPLLAQWEDFINNRLLPLIDADLAKLCVFKLAGLDAETAEKEAVRIGQDIDLFETMDSVLERVERDPIGKEWGGEMLLNAKFQTQVLDPYFTVGEILEHFMGREGYGDPQKHPELAYRRDPLWFQQAQLMQVQQQAQQQAQNPQPPQGGGSGGGSAPQGQPTQSQQAQDPQAQQAMQSAQASAQEVGGSVDQATQALGKSEDQLQPSARKLLKGHKDIVEKFRAAWAMESEALLRDVVAIARA